MQERGLARADAAEHRERLAGLHAEGDTGKRRRPIHSVAIAVVD